MFEVPHNALQELYEQWVGLLNEPNERAMIIVGFARLEALVQEIVGVVCPSLEELAFMRALRLLRSLGHVDQDCFDCCHSLAKIRNHFAHRYHNCSLTDAAINDAKQKLFGILNRAHDLNKDTEYVLKLLSDKIKVTTAVPATHAGWKSAENEMIRTAYDKLWIYLLIVRWQAKAPLQPLQLGFHAFKTV